VKLQRTDFFLGLGAVVLSGVYLYVASGIEESMLSDATGAGGVPRVLGWMMAALGVLLCLRSVSFTAPAPAASAAPSGEAAVAASPWTLNPHVQALVLLGILVAYVALAPYLGYMVATALLLAAVAAYGGAPIGRNLLLISAAGGIALWLSFAWALSIPMQTSLLLEWF
jgi:hypothetical protein